MQMNWKYVSFDDLSVAELYAILQLRYEVFVIEQNCIYQDADDKDQKSFHLMCWDGDKLVAYCRILPPGLSYKDPSIGRVVSSPAYRDRGYGRKLMKLAITKTHEQFNCKNITISAQQYLEKFYASLGFVKVSDPYLEDNIPHIQMEFES